MGVMTGVAHFLIFCEQTQLNRGDHFRFSVYIFCVFLVIKKQNYPELIGLLKQQKLAAN